jgi:hypothetical protein
MKVGNKVNIFRGQNLTKLLLESRRKVGETSGSVLLVDVLLSIQISQFLTAAEEGNAVIIRKDTLVGLHLFYFSPIRIDVT